MENQEKNHCATCKKVLSMVFLPCGHSNCNQCFHTLPTCPKCNKQFCDTVPIQHDAFFPEDEQKSKIMDSLEVQLANRNDFMTVWDECLELERNKLVTSLSIFITPACRKRYCSLIGLKEELVNKASTEALTTACRNLKISNLGNANFLRQQLKAVIDCALYIHP